MELLVQHLKINAKWEDGLSHGKTMIIQMRIFIGYHILDVMKKATIATDNTIEFSSNGLFKNKPDIVIAIYGEKPYAEMFGDIENIKFSDHAVLDQIKFIKSKNIPVVSIFISGRPLIVDEYIELSHLLRHGCQDQKSLALVIYYLKNLILILKGN